MVRQAHPGPDVPPYEWLDQKITDAQRHQEEERIPWPVLVDDVQGTVHQVYGGLSDPTYLIDSAGTVAFYNLWTNARTLNQAIQQLVAQDGRGIVCGGTDGKPGVLPVLIQGWRAIRRGLPQSYIDLETAMPGSGLALRIGSFFRPWLAERANGIEGEVFRPCGPSVVSEEGEVEANGRASRPVFAMTALAGAVAGAAAGYLLYQRFRT